MEKNKITVSELIYAFVTETNNLLENVLISKPSPAAILKNVVIFFTMSMKILIYCKFT